VGEEKARLGKTPTDVWWITIVPTNSKEKTGYPTQKPLKLLERIVRVHTQPGDWVLDFFAGSGTTGDAAARLGRHFVLIDNNPDAIRIMIQRLAFAQPELVGV
jgi:site-specific DNA-methyltransferase (adenine-specific)